MLIRLNSLSLVLVVVGSMPMPRLIISATILTKDWPTTVKQQLLQGTAFWCPHAQISLNIENRDLDRQNLRLYPRYLSWYWVSLKSTEKCGSSGDRNFGLPIDLAHRLYNCLLLLHKPWSYGENPNMSLNWYRVVTDGQRDKRTDRITVADTRFSYACSRA